MSQGYFRAVAAASPSRLWVNNPTRADSVFALENGASGSTTNPAFAGNLLKRDPDYVKGVIADVVSHGSTADTDRRLAELVQLRLVSEVVRPFHGLWEVTAGSEGFVSIQGSPFIRSAAKIIAAAHEGRALGPNAVPKIPATKAGLEGFEVLVKEGHPTIITEVFSLSQVVEACERYLGAVKGTSSQPPFFMSPITGIFGDHLKAVASRDRISVEPASIGWAGVALARAAYKLIQERGYPVVLLFGGARTQLDFTGLIGGRTAATLNCSTIRDLLESNPPVVNTIDAPVDERIISGLTVMFRDFSKAMTLGAVTVDEFEEFGPVRHFHSVFVEGWESLECEIHSERASS
jgi:transaldolase